MAKMKEMAVGGFTFRAEEFAPGIIRLRVRGGIEMAVGDAPETASIPRVNVDDDGLGCTILLTSRPEIIEALLGGEAGVSC